MVYCTEPGGPWRNIFKRRTSASLSCCSCPSGISCLDIKRHTSVNCIFKQCMYYSALKFLFGYSACETGSSGVTAAIMMSSEKGMLFYQISAIFLSQAFPHTLYASISCGDYLALDRGRLVM